MSEENIECECGIIISEMKFKDHFKDCSKLFNKYKDLDFKINKLIKEYIDSKESLIIVKFLFKRFIKLLEHKLKNYINNIKSGKESEEINSESKNIKNKLITPIETKEKKLKIKILKKIQLI